MSLSDRLNVNINEWNKVVYDKENIMYEKETVNKEMVNNNSTKKDEGK